MFIEIPDYKNLDLEYLVIDYNGTLAVDGIISEWIKERLIDLAEEFKIYILTADTYGTAKKMCEGLPVTLKTFPNDGALKAKQAIVEELGEDNCVAIGNGRNDKLMCRVSALSIAVLGQEGMCSRLMTEADVCVKSIEDALDLLVHPKRLVATLRG